MTVPSRPPVAGPGDDPRSHARVLRQVREAVLGGGTPSAPPRPVIGASWRRVRGGGLDPSGAGEIALLDADELHRRREDSGLAELMPVLRQRLLPAAEAAGQVMVVVDPTGRVLWREGGGGVRRRADTLGFVEGSAWDESSVGTNAIGTSLVVGEPVHVFAAEHYAETHQPWTCAAAPLHDPVTGRLLGAVDLSGPAATVHVGLVALVDAVARLVQLEVRAAHDRRHARLHDLAATLLPTLAGPAVVVGADGCTVAATGVRPPPRVLLPDQPGPGAGEVAGLGRGTLEALPGGWLVRLDPGRAGSGADDPPSRAVLDLAGPQPCLEMESAGGRWSHPLTPRHAEILLALARAPQGRSAADLADDIFGDRARTVTVRAEVSRLRRTLGPLLENLPYRFRRDVSVEVRAPERADQLLAGSDAPVVLRLRSLPPSGWSPGRGFGGRDRSPVS